MICAADLADGPLDGYLPSKLPGIDDPEGPRVPASLPPVIDGHVHLFPDRLFDSIWRWFDRYGWPIRYRLRSPEVIAFLLSRGVERIVALHYAHQPGLARGMNAYMAALCQAEPRVTGLATVFPGEPDAAALLAEAFQAGLAGVKLHCHVQCVAPDSPALRDVYEACVAWDRPLVIHAGREPKSPGYKCDPHALCAVDRIERVLRDHPSLKVCVPHLGADEFEGYAKLLDRYDHLWLDTTMTVAGFFPGASPWEELVRARPDRILYGTDFPNIPFAWDRELLRLARADVPEEALAQVLGTTARELFRVNRAPPTTDA